MFKNKSYFLQFQQTHVALIYSAVVMKFVAVDSVNHHIVALPENVCTEPVAFVTDARVNIILFFYWNYMMNQIIKIFFIVRTLLI